MHKDKSILYLSKQTIQESMKEVYKRNVFVVFYGSVALFCYVTM
jgi:hypothetical protein